MVYTLRSRTSKSKVLMRMIRRFYAMLDLHSISISIEYVPTDENEADAPSRIVDRADWRLSPSLWRRVDQLCGPHTYDRFASTASALLPKYDTLYRTPGRPSADAFAQAWEKEHNFVNPGWGSRRRPYLLLERVGQFLRARPSVAATVATPYRPGEAFFQALRRDSQQMHVLEVGSDDLLPCHDRVWLPTTRYLCLFRFIAGRPAPTYQGRFGASNLTWQQLLSMEGEALSHTTSFASSSSLCPTAWPPDV